MKLPTYAVHAPALTRVEAARLPALIRERKSARPKNLLLPNDHLDFRPMPAPVRPGRPGGMLLRAAGVTLPGPVTQRRGRH